MRWVAYVAVLGMSALSASAIHAETRGVLELFTSQGCSSCPPADKLMGDLIRDPSLVAFSLPVDYWDSLGWKDTLANPRNSERQRAYARLRGDRGVYTPQIVINGTAHVVGSDKAAIEGVLGAQTKLSVPVTAAIDRGQLTVVLPEAKGSGEVWVYALAKDVSVLVGRGENRGRTITYHNVARHWQKLGDWNGVAARFVVPLDRLTHDGADTAAVLIQSGTPERPGAMLGAAITALR